ncbi:helix-turn-helix domain-containing protein [Amycolatopsis sp.]|uniref:TetR/AcrR family transcriptional regulator n=1 Tax=Amycolatopsis sp. TaxID=37632 RepID=UPI002C1ED1F5|nr:helix-turn-helix domain-containing protein [Amycolatopsis sp.]HVV12965.1 helix-turn-helix domain-containing protein [Amycolatopsis sp.]
MGRREDKKAELRDRISDVATELFLERGFDAVTVTQVAEAAEVARPTVFAHFPRKEDLLFDRYPQAIGLLTGAIENRTEGTSAVLALRDLLVGLSRQGHPLAAIRPEFVPFWRLVAGSRPLLAYVRELFEAAEAEVAAAMKRTGVRDAELTAALALAAYRTVHLASIRKVLNGQKATGHEAAIRRVLGAVAALG